MTNNICIHDKNFSKNFPTHLIRIRNCIILKITNNFTILKIKNSI